VEILDGSRRRRGACWRRGAVCVACWRSASYLQHVVGLEPCPMCIVQRYRHGADRDRGRHCAAFRSRGAHWPAPALMVLLSGFGAFVAARQSWLQWNPPRSPPAAATSTG
jgi:disulfide bond formation protein DsbB